MLWFSFLIISCSANSKSVDEVFGKLVFSDGARYEGEIKSGTMHGYGVYIFSNGDKYEGQFSSGSMHGYGVLYLGFVMMYI